MSDGVTVKERESDHSYKVTFNTGEYEVESIAKLFLVPKEKNLKVSVEVEE